MIYLADITSRREVDFGDLPELSAEQEQLIRYWIDKMVHEFMLQATGAMQDAATFGYSYTVAPAPGEDPAAAPERAESSGGRAHSASVFAPWPYAYCGN